MRATRTLWAVLGAFGLWACPLRAASPGDVIFTEIMYNPNSDEGAASNAPLTEWVEIYNTTDQDIDLTGWYTADEDGRSGDFPSYVLPAHGVAVVIPVGNGSNLLTKAQFTAAWHTPAEKIIQPTATNDLSRGRPNTSGRGGIVGDGFSNSPTRDDDDDNDLVDTPFDPVSPCAYGQALCVAGPPDNEVLLLADNTGQLIDKVNFDDEFRGWPTDSPDGPSITLLESALSAGGNDEGASWSRSVIGQKQAKANAKVNWFLGDDIGSPGKLEGVTPSTNDYPDVGNQTVWASRNASMDVTLVATDDALPAPSTINFVIETLPANGTLTDVNNGNHVIAAGELPYTLAGQSSLVRYTNTGICGAVSFNYHANDTEMDSNTGTITLNVQCGDVIITEIMYDPASNESNAPRVVEWIEVYNTTAFAVDVSNWYLVDNNARSGDWPDGTMIPAGGVAVLVPRGTTSRPMTPASFLAAWNGYTISQIIQPDTGSGSNDGASGEIVGSGLSNSGEVLRLVDASGTFQDYVSYANAWPWAANNGESSIHLTEGNYTAGANDSAFNWRLSVDCAGGTYGGAITGTANGTFTAHDYGSPGFLAGVTSPTGNVPPIAVNKRIGVLKNTPKVITLPVCDAGGPGPASLTIKTLSMVNGTLRDNGNAHVIVAGELPYTLVNGGDQVEYTPNPGFTSVFGTGTGGGGQPNEDSFTYAVNDGALASWRDGTIILVVQKGGLVISEIMYNGANNARNDWQYYEVYNTTKNAIVLNTLTDDNGEPDPNMVLDAVIPAETLRVVTSGVNNASRTPAEFLAEWSPLPAESTIFFDATIWEKAGNESDRLQLLDAAGDLLDEVYFTSAAPWPVYDDRSSIAVKPGKINAIDNDEGANWELSVAGVNTAYATPDTPGGDPDSDVGSPATAPAPCLEPDCLGACCLPNNVCMMSTQGQCQGVWQGIGTTCAAFECPLVCPTPFADQDMDEDVDQDDFGAWQACFTGDLEGLGGLISVECGCFDRDGDQDVDGADFEDFKACVTGPAVPFDQQTPPGCQP